MKKIKVLSVFGTRPEAIKMAPLVKELETRKEIDSYVCVTAQHREMLDQVLEIFDIKPDFDLDIMKKEQTITSITVDILTEIEAIIKKLNPHIILVHGDTTTTLSSALAAFYSKTKIGHVEAGLRTYDKYSPYPEEMNRVLTTRMADLHFAATKSNKENLLKENIKDNIIITGNTVIDALKHTVKEDYIFKDDTLKKINFKDSKYILLTAHRRENLGEPLEEICRGINKLSEDKDLEDIKFIYPVHLNPKVQKTVRRQFENNPKVILIDPIDVEDMHNLMDRSYMILTDSGGLQEEAPSLGKPVLVLRNETERPEAITAGTVKLVGTDAEKIFKESKKLLREESKYNDMARAINPYGDGNASIRIADAIVDYFK